MQGGMRRRPASVRARLTLWNVGVLALALVGFALTVHMTLQVMLLRAIDADLAAAARPVVTGALHRLAPPPPPPDGRPQAFPLEGPFPPPQQGASPRPSPPPHDRPVRLPFREAHPPHPPPGGPRVFPPNGRSDAPAVIRFRGRDLSPRVLTPEGDALLPYSEGEPWDSRTFQSALKGDLLYSTVHASDTPMRVLSMPVLWEGRPQGVVQLAHPLTEMNELMRDLDRTLLLLIPLALLVAGAGGAFLTDRALRPVRRISRAAEEIGAEHLSRRLPEVGGDEFAALAASFNGTFDRLEKAFLELESAYERQRRFTADASHELRTPLTTIKANTSLALSGPRTPEQYRHALEAADHAADAMHRIVLDLLLLARSDSGQLVMERIPIPIAELLQRVAAAAAEGRETPELRCETTDPSLMVSGDDHHLARLFSNLIDNAIRHTPPEGRITLRAWPEGALVKVRVEDTGEGIAAEHLPHLCERFYRVDMARSRAQGGFGLGLSICRSIAEAHGGSVEIESALGRGTAVTVRLPKAEDSEGDGLLPLAPHGGLPLPG